MFKSSSCVYSNRGTLLYLRQPRYFQPAQITRLPPVNAIYPGDRKHAKTNIVPPLPPPPSNQEDRLYWSWLAALIIAGFGIFCAHRSPETRDWLSLYAPWLDDIIALIYQENMTYGQFAVQCVNDAKGYMTKLKPNRNQKFYSDAKSMADIPQSTVKNDQIR